jgi:hypothetical protein
MRDRNRHLSDAELLLAVDGEVSMEQERHYRDCDTCLARARELEQAAALVHADVPLPSHEVARARLRARLSDAAEQPAASPAWFPRWQGPALVASAAAVGCLAFLIVAHRPADIPSPRLTPGAARVVDRDALCRSDLPKNQVVPADLRQRVFQAYGIANSEARKYEVDYLITPALGGADDIRNLWPEPYVSTAWNAHVKDELEDRLRDLVCGGRLDLAEAQRAIATDWIAAYKKYVK